MKKLLLLSVFVLSMAIVGTAYAADPVKKDPVKVEKKDAKVEKKDEKAPAKGKKVEKKEETKKK